MGIIETTEQKSKEIDSIFQRIRNEEIAHMTSAITMPVEAVDWFRRNLDYNVPAGKLNNIMSVVDTVEILRGRPLLDDEHFKAALLEWCVRLHQTSQSHIYSDDQPHGRRGRHCWYAGDDIVLKDSLWLDVVKYYLLKKYFRTETYYVHLLELFQDASFQAGMSQLVKSITISKDHVDLSKFSLHKHTLMTRREIASFYLPVALAMCVCGIPESYTVDGRFFSPYTAAHSILLQLAEYFQIQTDFLNYLDTIAEGVTRSDIMENKCSWCINIALVMSSPEQRKVLEENYGQMDAEKEMRVREVYEMNGLEAQYRAHEAILKERIEGLIERIPEPEGNVDGIVLKRVVFSTFFNQIRDRSK